MAVRRLQPRLEPIASVLAALLEETLTIKRGGKGHWSAFEYEHPAQATEVPVSKHLPGCEARAANHYYPEQPCWAKCQRVRDAVGRARAEGW